MKFFGKNSKNSKGRTYSFAITAIAMAVCAGTAFAQTDDTFVSIPANGANESIEYVIEPTTVETEPAVEEETTETTTTTATTTTTTVTTTVTTTAVTTTTPETTTEVTTTEAPAIETEVVEFAVEAAAPAESTTYMTSTIEMSEEEMWLYQHILAAECYSWWDYEGHKMIADVISNRVRSGLFPNTMAEVLTAPGQFETYSNGRYLECEPNDLQVMACYESMNGVNMLVPEDVLFFCTQEYYDTLEEGAWFKTLRIWNVYDNTIFFHAN